MAAAAFLVVTRAGESVGGNGTDDGMLIPFTSNEIRRLLCRFILAVAHTAEYVWHWSRYRRRLEQARACHYRKRLKPP